MTEGQTTATSPTGATTFADQRGRSNELFAQAATLAPAGVHHNLRSAAPFPLFYERGEGPYKWDADGNRYLCYAMGQGSQILGYSPPAVVEAVRKYAAFGIPGGSHALEIEWARLVGELIPSAERTRFLASGTEATMLALRLARAHTGRSTVVRVQGHYNGWHDYGLIGYRAPFDEAATAGIPDEVLATVRTIRSDLSPSELEEVFAGEDVAAVILEPSGASWGTVPLPSHFLASLRDATRRHGTVLIFDEVITAFRWAPGGIQSLTGITPDLTSLGKILTGGLPGGAVAGAAEILDLLRPDKSPREGYVLHHGTFNGHPVPAAAGIATLTGAASGEAQQAADAHVAALRAGLQEIVESLSIAGFAYGDSSVFHLYLQSPDGEVVGDVSPETMTTERYLAMPRSLIAALHREVRSRGIDLFSYNGGMASGAHGDAELELALSAFDGALRALVQTGVVATA
ncbi:MAG: glutamate-semialdehyde -aminomutase [Solirubrobacteraceae bacterium]|nr:glutamate-semialdehyde -aminomutase [Solirubrobacteraceae bacterium]